MGTNIVAYMVNGATNQYSTTEMLDEVSEGENASRLQQEACKRLRSVLR